jgi:hypothetical protein
MPPVRKVKADVSEEKEMTADAIKTQFELAEREKANPSKSRGKRMLKEKHTKKEHDGVSENPQIGERESLREQILKMSLFPNVFNKSFLLAHG